MCTVLLPPGDNPIAVNKYIIRIQRDIIINAHRSSRQRCPLFLSDINKNLNFLDRFSKNPQMSNFMIIHPVGAELFHADGRKEGRT